MTSSAFLQLAADVQGCLPGGGAQDAIFFAVLATKVLNDGFEDADVVVDCENDGFRHK